ncbi:MAG: GatB/YqeY domain-containing protein [Anaerolineae bacterium]|nr:GatB/YqeY domain-containing protein [Anaerolineae bacterium]
MTLQEKIMNDMKEALRSGDELRKSTLRMLRSAIGYKEVEVQHPLSDDEVLDVIAKQVKQRQDSITEYAKGGRQDLVDQERAEMEILMSYLPQQLTREEIEALARQAIQKLGVTDIKQQGLVMKELMPQVKGRADGKLVNEVVRQLLGG